MAKKEVVKVIDDSVNLTEELEKMENKLKDELNEYKTELKEEVRKEIEKDFREDLKKENDKVIRRKNFHIFRLDILIVILLAIIGFLVYHLYDIGELDNIFEHNSKNNTEEKEEKKKEEKKEESKDKEWYIKEYGYLVDSVRITNTDLLKETKDIKDMDSSDKLAIAYLTLDSEMISKEEMVYQVSNKDMEDAYIKLFGSDKYKKSNFSINNLKYAYLSTTDTYIALNIDGEKEDTIISNYIDEIKEEKNNIIVSTYVYLDKDNQIFNINNLDKSLGKSKDGVEKYLEKLSKVDYIFEKNNKEYSLVKIEVE